jgi:hypothetical protein
VPSAPSGSTTQPTRAGLSNSAKALLAVGGVGAGLGATSMLMRKRKKNVSEKEAALDTLRFLVAKVAEHQLRKECEVTLTRYLDKVASTMPVAETVPIRTVQAQVARGQTLAGALKQAYPWLTGEQRGILAVNIAEQACKHAEIVSTPSIKTVQRASKTVKGKGLGQMKTHCG